MTEDQDPDLPVCAWCGGSFDRSDMDGDHCETCAEDIFEEMGLPL